MLKYKTELLGGYVKTLLNNGFKVYRWVDQGTEEPISWVYFEKENKIGSVYVGDYGGLNFSTCHKANRTTGTGYRMNEEEIFKPIVKNALDCFAVAPVWAKGKDLKFIKKYSSFEEYQHTEPVLKYVGVLE